jgi:N-methylhydantoinase A
VQTGDATYTVAVDIGGTFTDLVAVDVKTGKTITVKEPSVPSRFVDGVSAALTRVQLGHMSQFRHGTTVGTNAIIERAGARTGLITTAGFRDILPAGRANKPDVYDSDWDPPAPLVPRQRILTVRERVDYSGRVIVPLAEEEVVAAAEQLRADGVEAVAICFLNAFMNGEHEAASKAIVERVCTAAFVCTSSEVLPEIREFERTSTTVANAYLGPKIAGYLTELADRLRGDGDGDGDGDCEGVARLEGELLVSHSGGGLMTVASARERPARICQSGPAAGVMGARSVADRLGLPNAISLDMGGTSADIAAITEGEPAYRSESHIEFNIPIIYPAIDLVTIGAGGGTIAWIDATGALQSGPQSAGAEPGPVCYGRGGTQPTNTDANLVLGRLRADEFLGGRMRLDREAAHRAVADRIATPLGMTVEQAAAGMLRLSNTAMLNAIRLMTTQRGYDPREFALIAFGGAGGLHAADLAFDVGMKRVVIPRLPGVISAQGILAVDVRHDLLEPLFQRASMIDAERVHAAIARLDDATEALKERDRSVERWHVERRVDVRYFGQISGYLTLQMPDGDPVAALREIADGFGERHEREFGYALGHEIAEVELVNLRSALIGEVPNPPQPAFVPAQATSVRDVIPVWFSAEGAYLDTAFVDRDAIGRAETIEGPAIVTEWDSTTVVPRGATAVLAPSGELVVSARA